MLTPSSSNNNPSNNAGGGGSETYKSLGDVFGIQAAVSSINNNKMGHARSVTDVYKHVPLRAHSTNSAAHAHHRVSTYSNVSVPVSGGGSGSSSARFGTSDMRASYNEQRSGQRNSVHHQNNHHHHQLQPHAPPPNYPQHHRSIVYKSNSSLDLDHEVAVVQEAVSSVNLNSYQMRQFGSQGSINDLKSFDHVHGSNGPAAVSTLQRRGGPINNNTVINSNSDLKSEASSVISDTSSQSPKPSKKKGSGIFGSSSTDKSSSTPKISQNKSLFKKFKVNSSSASSSTSKAADHNVGNSSNEGSSVENGISERQASLDDRHRRRFFNHFDIGSLSASLNLSVKLKSQESRSRNIQTGASAASAALRGGIDECNSEDIDHGDHVCNDLVLR